MAILILGCSPSVDEGRAAQIAQDFVVAAQPSGTEFRELKVGSSELIAGAWRIRVDVRMIYPNDIQDVNAHYVIDVDSSTGAARIYAQG